MGSGYFPLGSGDKREILKNAISLIEGVIVHYEDDIFSGIDGQFDNTASDGGYITRLQIAVSLIDDCISKNR